MTRYEKRKFWDKWGMALGLYALMMCFALVASMDELIRRFT